MSRLMLYAVVILIAASAFCEVPARYEQLVYSIWAFNGKDYGGTFSGEDSDTIYLLAGTDNFATVRKTLVYFWPASQEPRTDITALNQEFVGLLEVSQGRNESRKIPVTEYTYYNVRGEYELNWKVDTGAAAYATHKSYTDMVAAHYQRMAEHQMESAAFDRRLRELTAEIAELRKAGKDFEDLFETAQSMRPPEPPQFPRIYMVPPAPVQRGYLLNLPVGEYDLRFLAENGDVMEGSERRIITFENRRKEGVGLEVIPSDRWTRIEESKTPSSVLYVNGKADLYLRAFYQDEYNDLYFEKLRSNHAKGNPNIMTWIRIQQVPKAKIELASAKGSAELISENAFFVEQAQGTALGYTIVPYDPSGPHKGKAPNLIAFHLPLAPGTERYGVRVQDGHGDFLSGSERKIRVVPESNRTFLLIILVLLPLGLLGLVRIFVARRYTP